VSYPSDSTLYTIIVDQNGTPNGLAGDDNQKLGFALTDFSVDPDDDNKALLALAKGFTVQLNVTTPTPRANEYRIFSYSVQWTSTLGKPHSRQGTAYINRYGLSSSYKQ
jgi:cytochrome oxidase Cu insertion factor (SCO1/SenC/PrrC family)